MAEARPGDGVRIHYTGRLENGVVFASSQGQPPVQFVVGGGQMLPAIDAAVRGMQAGEEKTITVRPEEGFGPRRPELQQRVPLTMLPAGVKVGDQLAARQGDQEVPVWVRELGVDFAVVDPNHPLAGETLTLEIHLVGIESAQPNPR